MSHLNKMVLVLALVAAHPQSLFAQDTPPSQNQDSPTLQDQELDSVAAIVNDSVITNSEVNEKVDAIKRQLAAANKPIPSDADMHKKVLNALINQQVQLEIADRADVQVDQEELNRALENMAQQNNVTLETMRTQIEAEGMSYAKFRNEVKTQIRLQKLQQNAVGGKVTVTDKEVEEVLAKMDSAGKNAIVEYHIANILISLPEAPTTEQVQKAQEKADQIMSKLKAGADFGKIANADSDGDQSLQGGDLGWRKVAEIPDIFVGKLKTMKEGEISEPLRAPNGFHILKLIEQHTDTTNAPDKNQIKSMLYNRKMSEKVGEWVQEMRDGAYVKIIA